MLNVYTMLQRRRILASPTGLALFGLAGFLMRDTATLMRATKLEHALFPNLCCARAHRTASHLPALTGILTPAAQAALAAESNRVDGEIGHYRRIDDRDGLPGPIASQTSRCSVYSSSQPTPRPDAKPGVRAFEAASMLSPGGIQSDPRLNTKGHGLH